MSDLIIVEYKTFVQHLNEGNVEDVKIYNYSSEIEVTYDLAGQIYATRSPYSAAEDDLLHSVLDNKEITYILLNEEHVDSNTSFTESAETASFMLMLIPLLLIGVIVIQSLTIKKLITQKS